MVRSICIGVALLGLSSFFRAEPVVSKAVTAELELRANLIVIEARINGVLKKFVLDTGASNTTVTQAVVDELSLKVAEKSKACGVGGEVEIMMVRVDSLAIGGRVLTDLTVGARGGDAICSTLGPDIAGVIGYDVLSNFEFTVNYREKRITFIPLELEPVTKFSIEGSKFVSPQYKMQLVKPGSSWEFVTETALPQILVVLQKPGKPGTITVQVREIRGMSLEQLTPFLESQVSARVEGFEKVSTGVRKVGRRDGYSLTYKGHKDGALLQFSHVIAKPNEFIYHVILSAPPAQFKSLAGEFGRLLDSIEFLE